MSAEAELDRPQKKAVERKPLDRRDDARPPEGRPSRDEPAGPSGEASGRARLEPRRGALGAARRLSQLRARFGRHRGWRSPLIRRVLALNVLVLAVPILGLLHLNQYRQSLISIELEAMGTQARAFAWSLGNTAAVGGIDGEERLFPDITRSLMRVLLGDSDLRARVFAPDGELIADSFMLVGPGGQVQVVELPPPDDGSMTGRLGQIYDAVIDWLPGIGSLPPYREGAVQKASDYDEVVRALGGDGDGLVRIDGNKRLVLTMAVPVQRYRQVLGALMISKDGDKIARGVRDRRRDVLVVFGIALLVSVLLSIYLAGTIARPVRRLALAASAVRYGRGRKFEIPDFTRRGDEIGDLSGALREMTESLWNRLDAIEHFAADVAHEIKNPLTSLRSAVETVARVEEPEQQRRLMSIILDDVQRLDRLISDISDASRLDAELSRAEGQPFDICRLLETLIEVHQAAQAEGQPKLELTLPEERPLMVQGLEGRLGQVFRNLISNAVSFSPAGGVIRLSARRDGDWILVTVEDEGPGLPEDNLESVFDRFYSERPEGEKFGTHSGLGLSISRQIVEAHNGTIVAENRSSDGPGLQGARFIVRLPVER